MKTIILSTVLAFSTLTVLAQNKTIIAFSKSYSLENAKEYNKAIGVINGIYSAKSYTINLRLGWLYYLNGDYQNSQNFYKKAIVLQPSSVEAKLGYAYPTASLKEWNNIIFNYKKILKIEPKNAQTNYKLAYIYHYIKKDNGATLTYLNQVLSSHPFDFDANYLMAKTHLNMGNIKEAKQAVIMALEYNPWSEAALKIYNTVK